MLVVVVYAPPLLASLGPACLTPGLQSLDSLGRGRTDKSSTNHDYLVTYAKVLEHMRQTARHVMEVGVFYGGSLTMWRDYFPNAFIVGVDPFSGKLGHGTSFQNHTAFLQRWQSQEVGPRIRLVQADQSKPSDLERLASCLADETCFRASSYSARSVPSRLESGWFDLIVDDGSHKNRDQLLTMAYLIPLVKPGGVYIIEDIHTSLQTRYDEKPLSPHTAFMTLSRFLNGSGLTSKHLDQTQIRTIETFVRGCQNVVPWRGRSITSMTCICFRHGATASSEMLTKPVSVLEQIYASGETRLGKGYVRPTRNAARSCL